MARAIWTGTIGFGLVSVPVRLYPATRRKDVRFREIDRLTGRRIHHQKVVDETAALTLPPRGTAILPTSSASARGTQETAQPALDLEPGSEPPVRMVAAPEPAPPRELRKKEREMAALLINTLAGPFEPERYPDTYRQRLTALLEGRAAQARPAPSEVLTGSGVQDLMAALQASVEQARAAKKRPPARRKRKSA